jgi:hypothetical protein
MKTWKQFNENISNKDYRKLKKLFDEVDLNNYLDEDDDDNYREFILSYKPYIVIGIDEGYDYNIVIKTHGEILYEKDLDEFDFNDFLIDVDFILKKQKAKNFNL